MKHLAQKVLIVLFSFSFLAIAFSKVNAEVSNSTNYSIDGSFGIFGGEKNSTNYRLTDTGGGFAPGFGNSGSYSACSGFQCTLAQVPAITFTLSTNVVALGTLTTGSVNTASHTATVTTNLGGYTLTVFDDGNLRSNSGADINDVGDGAVTTGSEEYGLATSKSGQNITQDTNCASSTFSASAITTSPQTVANATNPTGLSGDTTTLCYAASRSGLTPGGVYNHTVTYIATGSF